MFTSFGSGGQSANTGIRGILYPSCGRSHAASSLWGSIGVALGSQSVAYQHALWWLRYGFGWLCPAIKVGSWFFKVACFTNQYLLLPVRASCHLLQSWIVSV